MGQLGTGFGGKLQAGGEAPRPVCPNPRSRFRPPRVLVRILASGWRVLFLFGAPTIIWSVLHVPFHGAFRYETVLAVSAIPIGAWFALDVYIDKALKPLARGLLAYLFVAISFAGAYFLLYSFYPRCYSFSGDVRSSAESMQMTRLVTAARSSFRAIGLLTHVRSWAITEPDEQFLALLAERVIGRAGDHSRDWHVGNVTVAHFLVMMSPDTPTVSVYSLSDSLGVTSFEASNGGIEGVLIDQLVWRARTKPEYLAALDSLITYESALAREAAAELRRLKPERSFSLADFFYFSLVTVATVGFGDIVPNATSVRILVCLQILCGIGLLIAGVGSAHSPLSASRDGRAGE